jgi:UrcA family protein
MTTATTEHARAGKVRVSLPKITVAMLICGIVSAAGIAAASAATPDENELAVTVKFDPVTLSTDRGAHVLYRRLVAAAAEVCPAVASPHLIPRAVQQCREQSVARAVYQINNPKLVAVYQTNSKNG